MNDQVFKIKEVTNSGEKSNICNDILRSLPEWFGVESSIVDYVQKVRSMPFYAAYKNDGPVGFAAIKLHNSYTVEICVIGILKGYHRHGIGKMLVSCCEKYCHENKIEFLTVKTLAESKTKSKDEINSESENVSKDGSMDALKDISREDDSYRKTRLFYLSVGFRPLEVFPLFWDEDNPCLFMAKYVKDGACG